MSHTFTEPVEEKGHIEEEVLSHDYEEAHSRNSAGRLHHDDLRSLQRHRTDEGPKPLETSMVSDLPTRDMPAANHKDGSDQKVPSGAVDLRDKYKESLLKKLDSRAIAARRQRSSQRLD